MDVYDPKQKTEPLHTKLVPGVGRLPYPAYRGKEPYVFLSYAHRDSEKVFAEIKRFNEAGFHVWYDEGIAPGNEWSDEIAEALSKCAVFVVMLTPTSAPRENVLNEISYALEEGKPFLAIYLEETELPPGLKLRISRRQAILKYNMTDEEYEFKYVEAFTRFGLKRDKIVQSPAPVQTPAEVQAEAPAATASTAAKPFQPTPEAVAFAEKFYDDSPEDAKKRASGDLVRVGDFDVERGLLRGYYGTKKDITVPPFARVIGTRAFDKCSSFIESVDLNKAAVMIPGPFGVFFNCPNLKTVKIPPTMDTITPNMFQHCPNLTVYVRRSQVSPDFEARFTGKGIVFLDEE